MASAAPASRGPARTGAAPSFAPEFTAGPAELASALRRVGAGGAASLPFLAEATRRRLVGAAGGLSFRAASPVIGEGERAVMQDFEICMTVPRDSAFHAVAAALGRLVDEALALLEPPPLARPFVFNDVVVQRYPAGSFGITAHRDHVKYVGLVALVPLNGAARFFLCAERSGRGAREIPAPSGGLLLMRAPGFAGSRERPFHLVREVTEQRLSLGLRHDLRAT